MADGSGSKRVVMIHDATKGMSLRAIKSALVDLSLAPGDDLALLGVLPLIPTPTTSSSSSSISGCNYETFKEAYQSNTDFLRLHQLYQANKIGFRLFLVPTISAKKLGLEVAQSLKATWVILDRRIKKESKYFMENLSCGVSKVKRDGSVKFMRGPKPVISHMKLFPKIILSYNEMTSESSTDQTTLASSFGQYGGSHLKYDEMIPSGPGDQNN